MSQDRQALDLLQRIGAVGKQLAALTNQVAKAEKALKAMDSAPSTPSGNFPVVTLAGSLVMKAGDLNKGYYLPSGNYAILLCDGSNTTDFVWIRSGTGTPAVKNPDGTVLQTMSAQFQLLLKWTGSAWIKWSNGNVS